MAEKIERFSELCKMKYKDQAVWFLNGFWGKGVNPNVANEVYKAWELFVKLDKLGAEKKGEDGNELDQFWSAKYLEDSQSTMTALARKEAFKQIDKDNNGKMSCLEYLVWVHKKGINDTVDSPQGVSPELIEAQKKMEAVQRALEELAKVKLELQAALEELKKQEDAYNAKVKELEALSTQGGVKGNKAANELAQLKAEDPLPLRRAKITQEAAIRKVEKQENQLMRDLKEAQVAIDKAKSKGGVAPGLVWWMQRELHEADSRLPTSKQRYDHKKPFLFDPQESGDFKSGMMSPPLLSPR